MRKLPNRRQAPRRDRGSIAIVVALTLTMILGMGGLGADVGYVLYAQKRLQAAADAAALAGAADLWHSPFSKAQEKAMSYTAGQGNNNISPNISVRPATVTGLKLVNTKLPASGAVSTYNGIQVEQQAVVPLHFGRLIGFNAMTVKANAKAAAGGANSQAKYNIMLILDTTGSMNNPDNKCPGNNNKVLTRIECAQQGAMSLLTKLTNSGTNVGLMVFPPLAGSSTNADFLCSSKKQSVASSHSAVAPGVVTSGATYQVTGLGSGFLKDGVADTKASIVQALGGGPCGGIPAIGGLGTYYAQVLASAQAALMQMSQGQNPPAQNVIVLLSDGDASASKTQLGSVYTGDHGSECRAAVNKAASIKNAGTLIYTAAYIGSGITTASCSNGTTDLSPCTAMKNISSGPSYFFSDTCPNISGAHVDVNTAFSNIAYSLTKPRLIPANAM